MLTGFVAPTPGAALPFRVVIRRDGELIRALPVESLGAGERKLAELMRRETDELPGC